MLIIYQAQAVRDEPELGLGSSGQPHLLMPLNTGVGDRYCRLGGIRDLVVIQGVGVVMECARDSDPKILSFSYTASFALAQAYSSVTPLGHIFAQSCSSHELQ